MPLIELKKTSRSDDYFAENENSEVYEFYFRKKPYIRPYYFNKKENLIMSDFCHPVREIKSFFKMPCSEFPDRLQMTVCYFFAPLKSDIGAITFTRRNEEFTIKLSLEAGTETHSEMIWNFNKYLQAIKQAAKECGYRTGALSSSLDERNYAYTSIDFKLSATGNISHLINESLKIYSRIRKKAVLNLQKQAKLFKDNLND